MAFWVRGTVERKLKCPKCSLLDRYLFRRSAAVALVVGTGLTALNHGDTLAAGAYPWAHGWYKIPLTYVVPFLVATYGALANGYVNPERGGEQRTPL